MLGRIIEKRVEINFLPGPTRFNLMGSLFTAKVVSKSHNRMVLPFEHLKIEIFHSSLRKPNLLEALSKRINTFGKVNILMVHINTSSVNLMLRWLKNKSIKDLCTTYFELELVFASVDDVNALTNEFFYILLQYGRSLQIHILFGNEKPFIPKSLINYLIPWFDHVKRENAPDILVDICHKDNSEGKVQNKLFFLSRNYDDETYFFTRNPVLFEHSQILNPIFDTTFHSIVAHKMLSCYSSPETVTVLMNIITVRDICAIIKLQKATLFLTGFDVDLLLPIFILKKKAFVGSLLTQFDYAKLSLRIFSYNVSRSARKLRMDKQFIFERDHSTIKSLCNYLSHLGILEEYNGVSRSAPVLVTV